MKKNLFLKFFVLVAMALFTITACQNEDAIVNETGDLSQAEYTAMLNALKSKIDAAVNAEVKTLTESLNADKASFKSGSTSEAVQKRIIGTAIQIEALNAFKANTTEKIDAASTRALSDCGFASLQTLTNSDFTQRTFLTSFITSGDIYEVNRNNLIAKLSPLRKVGGII